ncbi:MAG: hypothetical protein HY812_10215 [Planctomycetes bacterium]|nr:hypothetical protein [Planctomycetota bacterium]
MPGALKSWDAAIFQMAFVAVGCLLPESRRALDRGRPWLPTLIVAAGLGGALFVEWLRPDCVRELAFAVAAALSAVIGLASGRMVRATLVRGATPAGRLRSWCAEIGGAAIALPIVEVLARVLGLGEARCAIGAGIAALLALTLLDRGQGAGEPAVPSGGEGPVLAQPFALTLLLGAALSLLAGGVQHLLSQRVRHIHDDSLVYTCCSCLALGALAVLCAARRPDRSLRGLPWICLSGACWIGLVALWTALAPEHDLTQALRDLLRLNVLEGYRHDIVISLALLGVPSFALGHAVSLLALARGDSARHAGVLLLAMLAAVWLGALLEKPLRPESAGSGVWFLFATGALLAATGGCAFRRTCPLA